MACRGIAQPIIDRQTQTGVKDMYTQFWINLLIDRARDIKDKQPHRMPESIVEELRQWVVENKSKIYNPFLSHSGT